jgi:hypothetical protein
MVFEDMCMSAVYESIGEYNVYGGMVHNVYGGMMHELGHGMYAQ